MILLGSIITCDDPSLAGVLSIVKQLMLLIQIVAPILLIVAASVSFIRLVENPDLKNGKMKIMRQFVAAAIVFFIPLSINVVLGILGENSNFSSCWMNAKEVKNQKVEYILIEENDYQKVLVDSNDYEKGEKQNTFLYGNNYNTGGYSYRGEVDAVIGQKLVEVAKTQLGVKYWSMHYGPKGSGEEGFGCAMFVAYCYNQVYFNGARGDFPLDSQPHNAFYGATTLFWANVAPGASHYNHGFVEVQPEEAIAGDVVAYIKSDAVNHPYSDRSNCNHVALYTGNGNIMEAGGRDEHSININASNLHFLHYTGYGTYS